MAHPPRRPYQRSIRTPSITAVLQNLLEVETATAQTLADRSGLPLDSIHQALARMGVLKLVRGQVDRTTDDEWGRLPYAYFLTGEGKNLAASWGLTPRPRDIPIQPVTEAAG